jgi:2-polyprenyl-6-hydroxyphenyl methylase/3-demethylubiquinone-9 3-methyltransferase
MQMHGYYDEHLSAERLRRCYDLAPPRIQRYLRAEVDYVLARVTPSDRVLELGCGFGRVLAPLVEKARSVVGIDSAGESLVDARRTLGTDDLDRSGAPHLCRMNAATLGFRDDVFDLVFAIQNGISVFGVDAVDLIGEGVRATRPGGTLLLASYSDRIWDARLDWFRTQSEHGLLGEIDEAATGDGVIVCRDGFRATTVTPEQFSAWTSELGLRARVTEVDGASVFCEIRVE